jgi:hydroxypyruvate isomerase
VLAGVETALLYAEATGVKRLHLMSGLGDPANEAALEAYRQSVALVAERLAAAGIDLLLEPINRRDMQGYFLHDFAVAEALIAELKLPNLKLQFDIYHRQILHGDVTMALRRLMPIVGHVQIASVPARNEPDSGEIAYTYLFAELDRLGFDGFVGCEYRPSAGTREGLGWFAPYAASPPQSG